MCVMELEPEKSNRWNLKSYIDTLSFGKTHVIVFLSLPSNLSLSHTHKQTHNLDTCSTVLFKRTGKDWNNMYLIGLL